MNFPQYLNYVGTFYVDQNLLYCGNFSKKIGMQGYGIVVSQNCSMMIGMWKGAESVGEIMELTPKFSAIGKMLKG